MSTYYVVAWFMALSLVIVAGGVMLLWRLARGMWRAWSAHQRRRDDD